MRKQIIHVAQDAIRRQDGSPAIICNTGGTAERHHELEIRHHNGDLIGTFKYSPDKPLSCGARVWLELNKEVAYASAGAA